MLHVRLDMLFARLAAYKRQRQCCASILARVQPLFHYSSATRKCILIKRYRASPLTSLRLLECGAGI